MNIEVSIGEIVDKLTILEIKKEHIKDEKKLENVLNEYNYLLKIVEEDLKMSKSDDLYIQLININRKLWNIEDEIRVKEKSKIFDEEFINLARAVYYTNDERAEVKKQINIKYQSAFVEEKSYEDYK